MSDASRDETMLSVLSPWGRGYDEGAKDMRERAAKLVETMRPTLTGTGGGYVQQTRHQFAAAIRALPIDAAQEVE